MSDLHTATQKTKQGIEWRGDLNFTRDGEELNLSYRQLVDPEFEEVMEMIDRDELGEFRDQLPSDLMDEYRELQEADELDDAEEARLAEIEDELEEESPDIFEIFSTDTFEGLRQAAIYGIEPDDEDMQTALRERGAEIEREYGHKVQQPEDTLPALQDDIEFMIRNATDFTSVTLGLRVLTGTVDERGNS